jgi:hypothetical protein
LRSWVGTWENVGRTGDSTIIASVVCVLGCPGRAPGRPGGQQGIGDLGIGGSRADIPDYSTKRDVVVLTPVVVYSTVARTGT